MSKLRTGLLATLLTATFATGFAVPSMADSIIIQSDNGTVVHRDRDYRRWDRRHFRRHDDDNYWERRHAARDWHRRHHRRDEPGISLRFNLGD